MKNNKKISAKYVFFILIFLIILIGTSYYIYLRYIDKKFSNVIYPGVIAESIDLSGLSKIQAANLLKETLVNSLEDKVLILKSLNNTYELSYTDISASLNIDAVINEAYNYGKDMNLFEKSKQINGKYPNVLPVIFTFDSTAITNIVATIESETNRDSSNSTLKRISYGNFEVTPELSSIVVDTETLNKNILDSINRDSPNETIIDVPISETKPPITSDLLNKVNTKISSHTTAMDNSPNRNHNIILSTSVINGRLLMPGEEFSFNDMLGDTTADKGYKSANIIVDNKIKEDYGGGICQVSTTLFNAIIKAGIAASELHHHTLPSIYAPLGLDATIDYTTADYKFINTLDSPIFIEGYTTYNSVTFDIFSDSSFLEKQYSFESKTIETIPLKTENVFDSTLPIGSTKIDVYGTPGYRVEVYKITKDINGSLLSRNLSYSHFYKPVTRIIKFNK
ncbi:MAG: VanW family protein [Clostridium sp.]